MYRVQEDLGYLRQNMNKIAKKWGKIKSLANHLPYFFAPNCLRKYDPARDLQSLSEAESQDVKVRVDMLNKIEDRLSLSQNASSYKKEYLEPFLNPIFDRVISRQVLVNI